MLKQEISEFSMGVKTLIREISAKYDQPRSIRLTRELAEYVIRINKEVPEIMLPELDEPDQIFDAHIAATWLQNELITIENLIPLAYKEKFRHVAIVAVPDVKKHSLDLGDPMPFRVLFVGPEKEKYFFGENVTEIFPRLYKAKLVRTGPSCIQEIVRRNKKLQDWCSVKQWDNGTYIGHVEPNLGVIFKGRTDRIRSPLTAPN